MANGTFTAQNKVRAGAYINFKSSQDNLPFVGDRGIVALPLPLSWGEGIIEVYGHELQSGASLAKVGMTANDDESLALRLALANANKVVIYRLDTGGTKASGVSPIGDEEDVLTITAKYAGTAGNKIKVVIKEEPITSGFEVITYMGSLVIDRQFVTDAEDLENNSVVDFSGAGALNATAGVTLEGGINGTITSDDYTDALDALSTVPFNVIALVGNTSTYNSVIEAKVKELRDELGIKVQAVLQNSDSNYEGIISISQGIETETGTIPVTEFVAWVAGVTAGAGAGQSNTYKEVEGAVDIVDNMTHDEIVDALMRGQMVLSKRRDGVVVVERDINTLHIASMEGSMDFQNNSVIRTLDSVHDYIVNIWETSFIGKIANTDSGRDTFKSSIIDYLASLNASSVIEDFNAESDISVEQGIQPEGVVAQLAIKPTSAMEKLYMTVVVG